MKDKYRRRIDILTFIYNKEYFGLPIFSLYFNITFLF